MKANVENSARLVLSVTNIATKHPPFSATERSIIGHKVQSCFLSMVKRPDWWRMIKELENSSHPIGLKVEDKPQ